MHQMLGDMDRRHHPARPRRALQGDVQREPTPCLAVPCVRRSASFGVIFGAHCRLGFHTGCKLLPHHRHADIGHTPPIVDAPPRVDRSAGGRLSFGDHAAGEGLPFGLNAAGQGLPFRLNAANKALPFRLNAAGQGLPFRDNAANKALPFRDNASGEWRPFSDDAADGDRSTHAGLASTPLAHRVAMRAAAATPP